MSEYPVSQPRLQAKDGYEEYWGWDSLSQYERIASALEEGAAYERIPSWQTGRIQLTNTPTL